VADAGEAVIGELQLSFGGRLIEPNLSFIADAIRTLGM